LQKLAFWSISPFKIFKIAQLFLSKFLPWKWGSKRKYETHIPSLNNLSQLVYRGGNIFKIVPEGYFCERWQWQFYWRHISNVHSLQNQKLIKKVNSKNGSTNPI
jgi:hypothetical protein